MGLDAWSAAAKRHIGYCPEVDTFYEEMSGRRFKGRDDGSPDGYSSGQGGAEPTQVLERVGIEVRGRALTRRIPKANAPSGKLA